MSTLRTSVTVKQSRHSSRGVWFDVQSEGPPLRITAIHAACTWSAFSSGGAVVLYGSEEGSGVGKERERGAWGQLAAGTLQHFSKGATRLVLSSPVSVRAEYFLAVCMIVPRYAQSPVLATDLKHGEASGATSIYSSSSCYCLSVGLE